MKDVKANAATGSAANKSAEGKERETEDRETDAPQKKHRITFGKLPTAAGKSNEAGGSGKGGTEDDASTDKRKLSFKDSTSVAVTADRKDCTPSLKEELTLKMANSFRYTRNNKSLTLQQRIFYEKNGYLVFPRLMPQHELDKCHRRFDDIVSGKAPRNGIIVMHDVKDRKSVNKIQDIHYDKDFCDYIKHKDILDIVEAVTGPNIMAIHSMLIAKPPDIGFGSSKHPPHQDLYYFPIRPADKIVAAWTAMEPCFRENGCLYVAPGTHTRDILYEHDYAPGAEPGTINKFYHGILDLPESLDWVHLEMEPGDTVFFHPLLIHGSGMNVSKRTRRAISCHYAAADCEYVDVSNTVQSRIAQELLEHLQKRYPGLDVSYQDIWRAKSTIARGIRSNL